MFGVWRGLDIKLRGALSPQATGILLVKFGQVLDMEPVAYIGHKQEETELSG